MKRAYSSLWILALAGLASCAWCSAAQPTTAPAAAVKPVGIGYNFDNTPIDRSNTERLTSYADMLDKVTPGVVAVYPSINMNDLNDPRLQRLMGRGFRTNPQIQNLSPDWASTTDSSGYLTFGAGSGCIISPDGFILTNAHVVSDDRFPVDGILVKLGDGRELEAKLIGLDKTTDLALIKIDAKDLPTIKLADSSKLRVGDIVFAVGNPMDVGLTVTKGIVSALNRRDLNITGNNSGLENYIQTDAAINEGNSGGPLVDANGRLVGLNSVIYSTSGGGGSIGIGFAIPSAEALRVVDDLYKDGKVHRGMLGVGLQEIDHNLAQTLGLPNTHGVLIDDADPTKPAGQAGVKNGDVVIKLNDDSIDSAGALRYLVAMSEPGATVNLTVLRDGQPKVFKVQVGDSEVMYPTKPAETTPVVRTPVTAAPLRPTRFSNSADILAGVSLTPLTPTLRNNLQFPDDVKGLVVTGVSPNSPFAYQFGGGTIVIVQANKKPVATLDDLRMQINPGKVNLFYVYAVNQNGEGKYSYITQVIPAQ